METDRNYLPAAGHDWLLPLYDPIVKLIGGDEARRALIDQAELQSGYRVLEVGSGTGTLLALIKRRYPTVEVVGLDPDAKALARARRKAAREGLSVQWDQGFADQLPYAEGSFHRVFSAFMFHHVPPPEREPMLVEVRRVLKPKGEFHLADFEAPDDSPHGFFARIFQSHAHVKENSEARILALMNHAGFSAARNMNRKRRFFGAIAYYRAMA